SPLAPRSRKWRPKLCQRPWEIPRLLGDSAADARSNLGTRSASVKPASTRRDGQKGSIQLRVRNLHEIRHIGPHQRGANALARVKLREHGAIQRKLADIGRWYVSEVARRGAIGLVV